MTAPLSLAAHPTGTAVFIVVAGVDALAFTVHGDCGGTLAHATLTLFPCATDDATLTTVFLALEGALAALRCAAVAPARLTAIGAGPVAALAGRRGMRMRSAASLAATAVRCTVAGVDTELATALQARSTNAGAALTAPVIVAAQTACATVLLARERGLAARRGIAIGETLLADIDTLSVVAARPTALDVGVGATHLVAAAVALRPGRADRSEQREREENCANRPHSMLLLSLLPSRAKGTHPRAIPKEWVLAGGRCP